MSHLGSGESRVRVNRGAATPFSSGRLFTPPPSLVISTPIYEMCLVLKGVYASLQKGIYGPLMAVWRYVVRCEPSLFFSLGYERVYLPLVKWQIHPFISKGTIYHYSGFSHFGQDILHRLYGVKSLPRISSFWSVFLLSCRAKIIIWHSCSFFLVNHTKACGTSPQIIKSAIFTPVLALVRSICIATFPHLNHADKHRVISRSFPWGLKGRMCHLLSHRTI